MIYHLDLLYRKEVQQYIPDHGPAVLITCCTSSLNIPSHLEAAAKESSREAFQRHSCGTNFEITPCEDGLILQEVVFLLNQQPIIS